MPEQNPKGEPPISAAWSGSWNWRSTWTRAREVLRDEGVLSLWFKVLGELLYRRAWVFERRLCAVEEPRPKMPDGVTIGELTSDDVASYRELRPDVDVDALRRRLDAGGRCFVARRGDRLLHAVWVSIGHADIEYLDRRLDMSPSDAYVYEAVTTPSARGSGLGSAVHQVISERLRGSNCRRLLGVVMPENRAGATAVPSWGYRRRGTLRTFRLGRRRWHLGQLDTVAPDLDADYWGRVPKRLEAGDHYLDPFLGGLKRERHLRLVREWGGLEPDGRLLKTDAFEEAMGSDSFLDDLCADVGEVWGMDIAPAVVLRACARSAHREVRWAIADVRRLPFPEGHFSTIVSTSTLDHFADPADLGRSLGELRRVLCPGGRLVVTLDNRQNVFDPLLRLALRFGGLPYYVGRSYTVTELRRELQAAGLEVRQTTSILQNPRLMAVVPVRLARWTRLRPLMRAVERLLVAAQRLEGTRWKYYTGSFVAAVAIRPREAPAASVGG